MLKKRRLYKCKHSIGAYPFEAFYDDSWQIVRSVGIKDGSVTMHLHDDEFDTEMTLPINNLRLKSRKATISDCTCFLRPGVDVCVLAKCSSESDPDAWFDARINSIERKPHEYECTCRFYVNYYSTSNPVNTGGNVLEKEVAEVVLDNISILQQLGRKPCEDDYYRWCYSEDCTSTYDARLYRGQFAYDISWFLVASTLKGYMFKIMSTNKKIVYQCFDCDECSSGSGPVSKAINFQRVDEVMRPNIRTFVPELHVLTTRSNVNGETLDGLQEDEFGDVSLYDLMGLRRSKRRNLQPERFVGSGIPKKPKYTPVRMGDYKPKSCNVENPPGTHTKVDDCVKPITWHAKTVHASALPSTDSPVLASGLPTAKSPVVASALPTAESPVLVKQHRPRDKAIENYLKKISKICREAKREAKSGQTIQEKREFTKISNDKVSSKGPSYYLNKKQYYDACKTFGKKYFTSAQYKEMIKFFMEKTASDTVKDEPPSASEWEKIRAAVPSNRWVDHCRQQQPVKDQVENDGLDDLWKEMEFSMNELRCLEETQTKDDAEFLNKDVEESSERDRKSCQHEYELDEQIGIICLLCGHVKTEIRYVVPSFVQTMGWVRYMEQCNERKFGYGHAGDGEDDLNLFGNPSSCRDNMTDHKEIDTVWALIPELKDWLHSHQKKAFEFLWRKIAGSLVPTEMQSASKRAGGCVISHSPGAGKSFLVISFLVSCLRLFPEKRPLILAPNTTLYAWTKEVKKWEVSFPLYQINAQQRHKHKSRSKMVYESSKYWKPNTEAMYAIDCLETLRKWHERPSILLMSYSCFHSFMREKSKLEHWRYITKVLQQSPGILILDEGHNPRSTRSMTRKELMKVETQQRILLSGTLFQNSFEEYFNTLSLARPSFISEVLIELNPIDRFRSRKTFIKGSKEKQARKLFVEEIAERINSNVEMSRRSGLYMLKKLTNDFIDVYEGGASDRLPGLEAYTLLIEPTITQKEVLSNLQKNESYRRYPLELELMITIASIHPYLVTKLGFASKYFSVNELEELGKLHFDMKKGSKVRFVVNLMHRCVRKKEKVLIFCRNIAPINLLVEVLERIFGWRKGEETLVMHGEQTLHERGEVIESFEDPEGVSKVLVASIAACSEGISLTAASRVVLLDSEWNPSKTKQAVARAFRHGQEKVVYVYRLLASGTMEEEKYNKTAWKTWVSRMIFVGSGVDDSSCRAKEHIEDDVLRDIVEEDEAKSIYKIMKDENLCNSQGKEADICSIF